MKTNKQSHKEMWGTMKYTNVSNGYRKQVETGQVKCLDKL